MNALTFIIIGVAVAAVIYGYNRGIVREAVSLCAVLLGIVACRMLGGVATSLAAGAMGADDPSNSAFSHYSAAIVGNGVLFLLVWVGVYLLGRMIRGAVRAVRLGLVERLAGAVYCTAKYMLILSLILNMLYIMIPTAAMWGANPPEGVVKCALGFAPWLFGSLVDTVAA